MTTAGLRDLERDLERLFREGSLSGSSDARLLERFVADGDAAAFEALVARHREMLLRTFRDLLGDPADVEEAFQTTAVILSRRAGSIREKDAMGGWLHRVACRVARRARAEAARRRAVEGRAVARRAREASNGPDPDPIVREELRAALHDEIDRLPDRYRRPVILCLLEGMTQEQAAARLGWTEGSVRGRLARGKARLRDRLTRRGIALAAVLAELAEPGPAAAARPILAAIATKAAGVALSLLLAVGGATLAVAMRDDETRPPIASAAAAPPAKPEPDTGPAELPSFRGGGPTDQSRAAALAPEVAARPVVFLGRVLGPSGEGVAGARISLVTDAWTLPMPQAVSGPDGSFRFAKTIGDFWRNFSSGGNATPHVQAVVLATHDRFGTAWVNLRVVGKDQKPAIGGDYPLTLRMAADLPIEGRLIADRGAPIAGAEVRVLRLYGVGRGDLSPILDALRKLDLAPYERTYPRIGPNHFEAAMVIPAVTTGADGRFTLRGVGRDRQANLIASGPGMDEMRWTVLNREDAIEVTKVVRERGPKASGSGVSVYGPAFDLRVRTAPTVAGVVRDADGRPVANALVFSNTTARTDRQGRYRFVRQQGRYRFWLGVQPPAGAPILGAARELEATSTSGEIVADFALPRAVVVSGRAIERGSGRPMVAAQDQGCHGPGPVMAGRVWYHPLAGNASATGNEVEGYFRHGTYGVGLDVGPVGADGAFRGFLPPGPGVLLLQADPGMPFMWEIMGPWKESDGLHLRFPYAPLARREPVDGAPRRPGEAADALPGVIGPIVLSTPIMGRRCVAYRVIDPAAGASSYAVDINIPATTRRRVRFVAPDGRPVRGATVTGLNADPKHPVILDDDEAEVVGLSPTEERPITAISPDDRYRVEATIRGNSADPIKLRMTR